MNNHPIADVWPMMDADKLNELAEDIRKNGQLVPVWLFEGKILDGRNRWAACKIAGVEPKTKEYTGDEPTAFAVALNDRRRHMNKGALAAVAAELELFFAKDAKRRQQEHGGTAPGKPKTLVEKIPEAIARPASQARDDKAESVKEKFPEPKQPQAREDHPEWTQQRIADEVGVSRQYAHEVLSSKKSDSDKTVDIPLCLQSRTDQADFRKLPQDMREAVGRWLRRQLS